MSSLSDAEVAENVDSPDTPEGELHDPWKDDPTAMSPFGGWFWAASFTVIVLIKSYMMGDIWWSDCVSVAVTVRRRAKFFFPKSSDRVII